MTEEGGSTDPKAEKKIEEKSRKVKKESTKSDDLKKKETSKNISFAGLRKNFDAFFFGLSIGIGFASSIFLARESNLIWYNKDTIHYFFSAVFQGFAAFFGILVVAIIFFIDKMNQNIDKKEKYLFKRVYDFRKRKYNEEIDERFFLEKINEIQSDTVLPEDIKKIFSNLNSYKLKKDRAKGSFSLYSANVIFVMSISLFFLTQCSGLVQTNVFWNVFSITFTVFISVSTLIFSSKIVYYFITMGDV